jgi:hypothetical protein
MPWTWTPIRKYLLIFSLCIGLVPLVGYLNFVFLVNSGELEHIDKIIKTQLEQDALYFSAIRTVTYSYKLSMFNRSKPKIVVLGSSRVWQFRSAYFAVPFVNLGGAMGTFQEGEKIFKEMAAIHKPEVVIIGLDPWWFGDGSAHFNVGNYNATGEEFQLDMIFTPCDWLLQGKISLQYYFNVLLGKKGNPFPAIGVYAATRKEGFYKDGSFYHFGTVTGFRNRADRKFENVLYKLKVGADPFMYSRSVNKKKWKEFMSLFKLAKNENYHLLIFLTPLPPRIIDLMTKMGDKYAYIDELRLMLSELKEHYYDFYDPRSFSSGDCEFVDGEHGGEVTYLRLLLAMSQDPSSGLSPYLKHEKIVQCIENYRGKAMVPPPFYKQPYTEGDFLELGCKKN